jgi:large subunit ribosomal protein L6
MSRVGKQPIPLAPQVKVAIEGSHVSVSGPRGELERDLPPEIQIEQQDGQLVLTRPNDEPRLRALHGLSRSLVANMVTGVTTGFSKGLEVQGVGYRIQAQGPKVVLQVGYSHPVEVDPPPGITFAVEGTTRLSVQGIDKELVGQTAANIRFIRKPEPYKGKGIRYQGEVVRRKAGKAGKGGKGSKR